MNEQQFKPAWRSLYLHFFAIVACLVIAAVISAKWLPAEYQQWLWRIAAAIVAYIVCSMLYKRNSLVLRISPDKVSLESGMISRQSVEISTQKISTIQVKQSVMQRIFNVGDIRLASSGTDEYEISACNMPNPHEIREAIHVNGRADAKTEEQEKAE